MKKASKISQISPDDTIDVLLYEDQETATRQHYTSQCDPQGIRLYTRKKLPEFKVIDLTFSVPDDKGTEKEITCSGVVVDCREDERTPLHEVFVKFLDMPDTCRERLQNISASGNNVYHFFENF